MPIRYIQTMGALAGIVTGIADVVEIDCTKPGPHEIACAKPVAVEVNMSITVTPVYGSGGD